MSEKRALGRGLSALIPQKVMQPDALENVTAESILQIPASKIKMSKYQPRLEFNEEKLKELVDSIREKGVVQPILVRPSADGFYELIAGERRLRAVKALGFETIPAIAKDVSDLDMLEISLIENIQREGLNPIEEAKAFQKFITDFAFTQDKIAQVLGKDRSTVANTIRLLNLPDAIQAHISSGAITAGHARALLALPTESLQMRLCAAVIKKGLSVREIEQMISKRNGPGRKARPEREPEIADIESALQQSLGTRVKIFHGKKRGKIQIDYYSSDDLNRIAGLFLAKKA